MLSAYSFLVSAFAECLGIYLRFAVAAGGGHFWRVAGLKSAPMTRIMDGFAGGAGAGAGAELSLQQLPGLIKEWMATESDLKTLSAEVREKRKRSKLVKAMIVSIMKGGKIGKLNISAGAVTTRVKNAKAPLTKKFIAETLTGFFNGDAAKAAACAAYLEENRPLKTTESLTLDPA